MTIHEFKVTVQPPRKTVVIYAKDARTALERARKAEPTESKVIEAEGVKDASAGAKVLSTCGRCRALILTYPDGLQDAYTLSEGVLSTGGDDSVSVPLCSHCAPKEKPE